MLPRRPVERLPLPVLPSPAGRSGFPLVATLAPLAVAVALWAVTRSPYSLLFALLGPVVALGGLIDSRIARRRSGRRDLERYREALGRVRERIAAEHDGERDRLARLAPIGVLAAREGTADRLRGWGDEVVGAVPVRVGRGALPSPVEVTGDDPDVLPDDARAELAAVRAAAVRLENATLLVDARDGIGIVGARAATEAIARGIAVQLAGRMSPASTTLTTAESELGWAKTLPHSVAAGAAGQHVFSTESIRVVVAWAHSVEELPLGCGVVLTLGGDGAVLEPEDPGTRVEAVMPLATSRTRARNAAGALAAVADAHGLRPAAQLLPSSVALGDLLDEVRSAIGPDDPAHDGLAAPIGRDAHGPVVLDLVADGPHAIVAGTTGSGKSELLVSWILGMAALHSPDQVSFLLIDFKGGAAFAPLNGVPHVLATLSDLDARLTRRAIESLRAELLDRERILALHGARSVAELPPGVLARLVIVVDEFAAVVAESPELHEVFSDLAARGRSLGLHLVLCTQRPSGVIRDAVLANVTVRISLRVTDRGDSTAMIGTDAASRLAVEPRGRAILVDGESTREVQLALANPIDARRVQSAFGPPSTARPWCDPLPERIELDELPTELGSAATRGFAFGLVDLPAERSQPVASHEPSAHGHLLVMGTAGSGKSTALATIAVSGERAGAPVLFLSSDPADAWGQLAAVMEGGFRGLLFADDLDLLVARFDDDYRHDVIDLLSRLAREGSARGVQLIAAAQRLPGALSALAGLFGSRLLLRQSSREEHVLAGGDGSQFDPTLPPGSGRWRGAVVQVAVPTSPPTGSLPVPPSIVRVGDHRILAVVAARPRELRARLRSSGALVIELGAASADLLREALETLAAPGAQQTSPTVLLGDPDAWNAEWATLTMARRELPIVLLDCTPADHRALLRDRQLPPLLGQLPGECWLADAGRTVRAVFDAASTEQGTPENRSERPLSPLIS